MGRVNLTSVFNFLTEEESNEIAVEVENVRDEMESGIEEDSRKLEVEGCK